MKNKTTDKHNKSYMDMLEKLIQLIEQQSNMRKKVYERGIIVHEFKRVEKIKYNNKMLFVSFVIALSMNIIITLLATFLNSAGILSFFMGVYSVGFYYLFLHKH